MNGRKIVAHEKELTKKSLTLTKAKPFLENEIKMSPAKAKKKTWAIEKRVALFSFKSNFLLGILLWCFLLITIDTL